MAIRAPNRQDRDGGVFLFRFGTWLNKENATGKLPLLALLRTEQEATRSKGHRYERSTKGQDRHGPFGLTEGE